MAKWWLKCSKREIIECHFSGQGLWHISRGFGKILHFRTGQESRKSPEGLRTKPKVQQSRYSRLTQSLSQSTCVALEMNFAQVSPNNSEMTSDIVSQIRRCEKHAFFYDFDLISALILMVKNFDFWMLTDEGEKKTLRWFEFLPVQLDESFFKHIVFNWACMQINMIWHSLMLAYIAYSIIST